MDIDDLLPHRPPMRLVDRVEKFDAEARSAVVSMTVGADSPFFDGEGVPGWVAIECMAQAAAALVGLNDRATSPDAPPKPGLLLGTRRFDLALERFEVGATYRIAATCAYEDADAAAFECRIADASGGTVATAKLNAYRPPDMAKFLKEQTER